MTKNKHGDWINLISCQHTYRWVVVISWLNCLILAVDRWGSSAQHLVKYAVGLAMGSSAIVHIHHAAYYHYYMRVFLAKFLTGGFSPKSE